MERDQINLRCGHQDNNRLFGLVPAQVLNETQLRTKERTVVGLLVVSCS